MFKFEANFASSSEAFERGRLTLRGLINLAPNEACVYARRPLLDLSMCAPDALMGEIARSTVVTILIPTYKEAACTKSPLASMFG